nr:zinc finger, CCHC-type [Tanacetum cinerariifolium]
MFLEITIFEPSHRLNTTTFKRHQLCEFLQKQLKVVLALDETKSDITIFGTKDKEKALLLLKSLSSSYGNFTETLLLLEDMLATLNSRTLQKMIEAMVMVLSSSEADGHVNADLMIVMSVEQLLDWIMNSEGSYHMTYMRDYLLDFEEYDSGNLLLGDGRECRARGTGKVRVQIRDGSSFMLDNVRRPGSDKEDIEGYEAARRISYWVKDQDNIKKMMLESVKVKYIFLGYCEGIVGNKLWRLDDVLQVVLYRNMGFNEGEEYKETLIGLVEQHTTRKLFRYIEDNNEVAFAVAEAKKIYVHAALTFNDIVACEYAPGMFIHLSLYIDSMVFTCGCKAEIWVTKGFLDKAWGNIHGMDIFRDQSGNILRVSQSRFYNRKLLHTLLEGYSMPSLESSLIEGCDVGKNDRWSYIYG